MKGILHESARQLDLSGSFIPDESVFESVRGKTLLTFGF